MEAPADQTMDEAKVEKELGNDYEVGLCQKCDKPCVILGLLVCLPLQCLRLHQSEATR